MTDPSKWAQERAEDLADMAVGYRNSPALYSMMASAIADELDEAERRILARLKNPDEAMVEAVRGYVFLGDEGIAARVCHALADHLAKQGASDD